MQQEIHLFNRTDAILRLGIKGPEENRAPREEKRTPNRLKTAFSNRRKREFPLGGETALWKKWKTIFAKNAWSNDLRFFKLHIFNSVFFSFISSVFILFHIS